MIVLAGPPCTAHSVLCTEQKRRSVARPPGTACAFVCLLILASSSQTCSTRPARHAASAHQPCHLPPLKQILRGAPCQALTARPGRCRQGKRVVVSGSGNVAVYTVEKLLELGRGAADQALP